MKCFRITARLVLAAALAIPGISQAASAGSAGASSGVVRLGVVNWIGYGPIYCAIANGYYRKYGPDVQLVTFNDNSIMPGALEGGELQATTLTYDQVIAAASKGWKLKVVMPLDYSVGGDAIVSRAPIRSVKDLKGLKVAFEPLSPSDFLLAYALTQSGLSQKDVRAVNSTAAQVVSVMATGAVDAGVTYEPSVSTISKLGGGSQFHVLFSSREARGMITDVLTLKESTIARQPKLVEALIRGTLDGLDYMRKEPDKAAEVIGKVLGIGAADVKAQLANVENPALGQLGEVFQKSTALPSFYASGGLIGEILRKEGQIPTLPPIEATFDSRFVAALQGHAGALP